MGRTSQAQATNYSVIWRPDPGPQEALISSPVFEIFYGGARGGGKTDGVLGEWVRHQDLYGAAASGLMVRRTFKQLEDTIKRAKELYIPLGAKFNESTSTVVFPNNASLRFRYLERDEDAQNYQGHSYTRVYVEEIGTFPSPAPIFKLMATLRSGAGVPCGFRATGNPGGPGHQWVRARYIDPAPLGWKIIEETFKNPWDGTTITRDRVYIPSRVKDNKHIGNDYIANLHMVGSPTLVRAWLEGDWNVIEGAFFPEFQESRHVITPFAIPDDWLCFRSMDWGSASPFCCLWWAVVGDNYSRGNEALSSTGTPAGAMGTRGAPQARDVGLPRGAIVCYREWYGSSDGHASHTGLKLTAEEVAKGIVSRETAANERDDGPRKIAYGVLDPSAFAQDGGPSIAERMARSGVYFRPADNKRVTMRGAMGGWDQVRSRLIGHDNRPMMYFFETCTASIQELPGLQHDPDKPEDVDTEGIDHASDSIRYACMARPFVRNIEEVKKPKLLGVGPHNEFTLNDLWDEEQMRRGSQ